ncbi:hypothetical protein GARC_0159 [Paraglaciecola arctica BSs20135]|uniref:Uncharacterized protein n=1 Tax=Paraglaciecola arctica BSs20135 TaxID=493475 RepID=K6XZQ0_9ALTE|nr:hypothetical protein GARC_0159 [Paraglaciecola arctica BSs20135]
MIHAALKNIAPLKPTDISIKVDVNTYDNYRKQITLTSPPQIHNNKSPNTCLSFYQSRCKTPQFGLTFQSIEIYSTAHGCNFQIFST